MKVLIHHIYEFEKGLRSLVLHTLPAAARAEAVARLERRGICYHLEPVGRDKLNIFFGHPVCIAVVTRICRKPLALLTPEEDFMLGTMLGYSRLLQCERYLQRADRQRPAPRLEAEADTPSRVA